jgi:hypothetical protein
LRDQRYERFEAGALASLKRHMLLSADLESRMRHAAEFGFDFEA